MQRQTSTDRRLSENQSAKETGISIQSRAQRLLAEYLRMWGLRDPQAIAEQTARWSSQCNDISSDAAAPSSLTDCYRRVMRGAMSDIENWVDQLASSACDS